ncbi:MAG: hypothetical protein ACOVP3_01775 [Rhodoluna sp.]
MANAKDNDVNYIALTVGLTETTFHEVVAAAPRKIREVLFARLNIKAKKKTLGVGSLNVHAKLEDRSRKLHERLKEARTVEENKLCEELLRSWLYTKRPLLKAALDFLNIKNDDGLVEEEPVFFQKLDEAKTRELIAHLTPNFPLEQIEVYLTFVKVPNIGTIVASLKEGAAA